jgi:hypothetical protein
LIVFVIAALVMPFLPLYIERTMLRSWRMDRHSDLIEWGWKLRTLSSYWSDYHYIKREQQPALWLTVNLALAFIYALVIALGVDQFFARRKRRLARAH